ncbi:MAG TPA: TetR family transcriptional regulator [Nocardioides sp.]|uniref:TetR/AcrR family transcriptional regulator n=1 Tax=Nocardioides sp. TaxID=35761 RepID=UPI002F4107D7
MNKARNRGRPRGTTTTRADILAAAHRRFLEDGYDRVTLRAVAADAGVDVALISYYFGSKKGLFGAAMALAANPPDLLAREMHGPLNSLPERLVLTVARAWDDAETGPSLRTFLEAVVRDPNVARGFREMMEQEMLPSIADRIGGDAAATRRAALVASQLAGLILTRYLLRVEPIASMPAPELARWMAPSLRSALAGPTPPPESRRARPAAPARR